MLDSMKWFPLLLVLGASPGGLWSASASYFDSDTTVFTSEPNVFTTTTVCEIIYEGVYMAPGCTPAGTADAHCDVTTTVSTTITDASVCATLYTTVSPSTPAPSTTNSLVSTTVTAGAGSSEITAPTLSSTGTTPGNTATDSSTSTTNVPTSSTAVGGTAPTESSGTSQVITSSSSVELGPTNSASSPPSSQTEGSTASSLSSSNSARSTGSSGQPESSQPASSSTSDVSISQSTVSTTNIASTTASSIENSSSPSIISSSSATDLVTTISIPGIGFSTISLGAGETTTIPLPAGQLTTLSGPATVEETTIPLPGGQQTTISLVPGSGTTLSLPGIGVTTIVPSLATSADSITSNSVPSSSAITTSISTPAIPESSNPMPSSSPVVTSTPSDIPTPSGLTTSSEPPTTSSITSTMSTPDSPVPSSSPVTASSTLSAVPTTSGDATALSSNTASTTLASSTTAPTSSNPTSADSGTSSTTATSSTASQTPVAAASLLPVPSVRVFFDNSSYLLPPCTAEPVLILLSDGFQGATLYCDRIVIHGHVFYLPSDISGSPKVTQAGWTVRWTPRGIRNNLSPEQIRDTFVRIISAAGDAGSGDGSATTGDGGGGGGGGGGLGGLFSLSGKLGGGLMNIAYDAAAGLSDMGGSYEMQALNNIQNTANQVKQAFSTLGEDVSSAIESLRTSTPDIMPRDLDTINELGSGITQAENHWQQFLNLADISGATAAGHALFQLATTTPILPIVVPMSAGIWGLNLAIRHKNRLSHLLTPGWSPDAPEDERPDQPKSALYYIHCKRGTTVTQFNALKQLIGLDKNGIAMGINSWFPNVAPAYFVSLNQSDAEMIKYLPIVNFIMKQPTYKDTQDPLYDQGPDIGVAFSKDVSSDFDDALPNDDPELLGSDKGSSFLKDDDLYSSKSARSTGRPNKQISEPDPFAPFHLKILSAPRDTDPSTQPYLSDDSSGKDSWIFILDAGFNIKNVSQELNSGADHPARREIRTYVVPNDLTLPELDETQTFDGIRHAPENMDDVTFDPQLIPGVNTITQGHGTAVACIAGGSLTGVARNANLFLIKWKNMMVQDGRYIEERLKVPAIKRSFDKIIDAIVHEGIPAPRSTVLITVAGDFKDMPSFGSRKYDDFTQDYLDRFEELGVTVVMAAGNYGINRLTGHVQAYLGDQWPQRLGNAKNSLITVGGTDRRGSLFVDTSPEGNWAQSFDYPTGSMTLYAMGKQVMSYNAHGDPTPKTGTSFAAPAVAGLVAYYQTLYSNTDLFVWHPEDENTGDTVGRRIKTYLIEKSFSRVDDDLRVDPTDTYPPYPIPAYINTAYNMARGDQCQARDPDYCPAVSSSTSSLINPTSTSSGPAIKASSTEQSPRGLTVASSDSLARFSVSDFTPKPPDSLALVSLSGYTRKTALSSGKLVATTLPKTRDVATTAATSITPEVAYAQPTPSTFRIVTIASTND
ncbi:hypothetical protein F5X99DRAFT_426929 [Biscogniauxia marginata]|nr:hypothetical protein F5X99DRAFT_426929 [Biscogniauxia marginata]